MDQSLNVRIEREDPLPSLSGWVVTIGIRWCIVAGTHGAFDGRHVAIRVRDVRSVHVDSSVAIRELDEARRPTSPRGVDPTATATLLSTAGECFGVVTVVIERGRRVRRWTGRVLWTFEKQLTLGCVDPKTLAPRRAETLRFRDISRVEFGARQLSRPDQLRND